jgi:ABC-type sugar transport system ATPase subunit
MKVWVCQAPNGAWSTRRSPFGAQMRLETERLHRELGTTMIHLIYDLVEAMT